MEKRLLIAALASLVVLVLWQFLAPRPPRPVSVPPARTASAVSPQRTPAAAVEALAEQSASEESLTRLENGYLRATFSNRGAVLTSLLLSHHRDDERRPLELVRTLPPAVPRPFSLEFEKDAEATGRAARALYVVEKRSDRVVRFRYSDGKLAVWKQVSLGPGYLFEVEASASSGPYTLFAGTDLRNRSEREKGSMYAMPTRAVAKVGARLQRVGYDKLKGPVGLAIPEGGFVGLEDNYFLAVLLPAEPATARVIPVGKPVSSVAAGVSATGTIKARAFFGPKDVEVLEGLGLGLERTVDFGWFEILARPLLWLLKKTYSWVGNYGVAILIVTLLIRILLFPLMHKSYVSMKKMQKLAPKMTAIREKYKRARTDPAQRQRMNQEMTALYRAEGYNPMSGCFPILLQLPVVIAFYNVLRFAIELRQAPFVLWIQDLSSVDRSYILVILMTVAMYVQQAMTPSSADPVQKKIFLLMPLVMGFFFKDTPSGLVLYWTFSTMLTIFQQLLISRIGAKEEAEPGKPRRLRRAGA